MFQRLTLSPSLVLLSLSNPVAMKASRYVIVIKFQVDTVKLTDDKDRLFYCHYRLGILFACTGLKKLSFQHLLALPVTFIL
jgi:hypothetical protein